jgi:hypothetical protein
MKKHESKCVQLKRKGAEYVAKLLAGKTEQEQLLFWQTRTNKLKSQVYECKLMA